MKRSAGFTLIELVIVIIILGILAVTAAPKFLNLQSDARVSTLSGMKAAMESASSVVYSKAVISGYEKNASGSSVSAGSSTVALVYGYPAATSAGIGNALELNATDWTVSSATGSYVLYPAGAPTTCTVSYSAATSTARPTITVAAASDC